jgi:hypothetical protein
MQPRNRSLIQALNESNKCKIKQRKKTDVHPKIKAKIPGKKLTKNERDTNNFSGTVVKSESIHLRSTTGLVCDVFGHLVQAA